MKKLTKKQKLLQLQTKRVLVFGYIVAFVSIMIWLGLIRAAAPKPQEHLVTFYDHGVESTVITTASKVRGALQAAAIDVDPHDVVDPAVDTKLTKSHTDVIIYRSRLVAIVDGSTRQTVMTTMQSPNGILKAAGLKGISPSDKTVFSKGDFLDDGAQVMLTVSRQQPVNVPVHISFQPKPNALTQARGAQVYVDGNSVAHRETYYDLPMNVAIKSCGAANTYTIRSDGAKIDQDGYILVAANLAVYPRCTVVDTSMGPGKVYDTGGFAVRYPYGFDLATDWTNHDGI